MVDHYERLATELEEAGADPQKVAERRATAAAFREALPRFDELPAAEKAAPRDPNALRGAPFSRAKVIEAGRHAVTVATDERHALADDVKTYRIYAKPEGGLDDVKTPSRDLGRELGNVQLKQRDDGRWEVSMVEVKPSARGRVSRETSTPPSSRISASRCSPRACCCRTATRCGSGATPRR